MDESTRDRLIQMKQEEEDWAKRASESALPEQRSLTWGSYFLRAMPELGYYIFGRVFTVEEIAADEEPIVVTGKQRSHERGYRYGIYHSVVEPDGEIGDTHMALLWPITEEDFNKAKEAGWQPAPSTLYRVSKEMTDSMEKAGIE